MSVENPTPWASLVDSLRADAPISVLEKSEQQLKEILREEMSVAVDGRSIRQLASFQHDLGFLLKYKSYAVKAASPLGYSVFLQRPREGFSFQQHVTHKTEIFFILDVQPGGFVFLCDIDDWRRIYDRDAFLEWLNGASDERYERFRFVPQPGDVIVIDRLNVVHSVVGCVLAEFATVSTDMVDRLHDQNEGRSIPSEFTREFSEGRIRSLVWPETSREVRFGPAGWSRSRIVSSSITGGRRTTFGDGGRFSASALHLDAGACSDVMSDASRATSLHFATGAGELFLGTADELRRSTRPSLAAKAGDLFLVAPGAHYAIANTGTTPLVVAEHQIEADVAFV